MYKWYEYFSKPTTRHRYILCTLITINQYVESYVESYVGAYFLPSMPFQLYTNKIFFSLHWTHGHRIRQIKVWRNRSNWMNRKDRVMYDSMLNNSGMDMYDASSIFLFTITMVLQGQMESSKTISTAFETVTYMGGKYYPVRPRIRMLGALGFIWI